MADDAAGNESCVRLQVADSLFKLFLRGSDKMLPTTTFPD